MAFFGNLIIFTIVSVSVSLTYHTINRRQHLRSTLEIKSVDHSIKSPVQFTKYEGLGNDFILIDNLQYSEPIFTPEQAIKICNRNFGVGGDGVIFAMPGQNVRTL